MIIQLFNASLTLKIVLGKFCEKLLATRLIKITAEEKLIPDHQFGFREKHEVHRVVGIVNKTLDERKYCSALSLNISQAFVKVCHQGLLFK